MRQIKAILFDCDGVLIDSEPMGCTALAETVTAHGRQMDREEATRIFSGNSAAASKAWLQAAGLPAEQVFDEADARLFAMFDAHVPLVPGIEKLLQEFKGKIAVCSNSLIRRLDRSICKTTIAARFNGHIYSAEHVARPKPAPDLAVFAAARLGVAPTDSLFIDDNVQGIQCGKAAGCLTVGFIGPSDHRPGHAERLLAAGADHVVYTMEELGELLRSACLTETEMS